MSSDHLEPGEGHSPAAWSGVAIMLVGIAASTLGLFIGMWWLFFTGIGVMVFGILAGVVMSKLGYGANGPKYTPKSHK